MTSADAPSPWSEDDLTRLHRFALQGLLRYVALPPGAEAGSAGAGRPVRGWCGLPGGRR